ncbi:hypothetical protein H7849_08745 [Alloacidobacterium dinghuense]|uniref:Uncharacterized protein n=1 Tax=Alloacidobacterium dinghuense TaxID=2763107 RepID=A0A7G8BN56_9BACT|nr:hypothetical protein [Alloacidobacterium dinghuense]QNI33976.1 hypothetical protein H7849_08745 [Alloacidobacterium dinghuense]
MHFQTWHDKAGNCPPLKGVKDPVSGDTVDFPDISKFAGNEDLQANLIMPEPTSFLNRKFPPVSIIRPTATRGAAAATVKAFVDDGLFIGQSPAFFKYINDLAEDADEARRRN